MRKPRLLVTALAVSLVANSFSLRSTRLEVKSARDLINALVATLNSTSEGRIRNFIQQWALPNASIERRTEKWLDLAKQGGPFKIVADGSETSEEIDTMVLDKDGTRLAFKLHIESKPDLRIVGLQIAPAFTVEGLPTDFASWSDLKQLATALSKKSQSPGMGIATIRNGVAEVGVAGVRSIVGHDPVQSNDVWSIGSIGKSICSTVIGRLIDQRKLAWDENLKTALPGIPMNKLYEKVTLEQVMRHRGGIPQDLGFRLSEVQRIVGSASTPFSIRDHYIRDILKRRPIAAPNERFEYSNGGYALLSHIAEIAAATPYEKLVKETVFVPLGLAHSFTAADPLPKLRPTGHVQGPKGLVPSEMTGAIESMFAGAGGGMFMSVSDLAKFGQAHLNGLHGIDGLLRSATVKRLHQGLPEPPGGQRLYACGWGIETLPGLEPFHGHNGSNGTMRAQLAVFPSYNLVVAAIVNRGGEEEPAAGLEAVMAIAKRYAGKP